MRVGTFIWPTVIEKKHRTHYMTHCTYRTSDLTYRTLFSLAGKALLERHASPDTHTRRHTGAVRDQGCVV